MGAGLEEQLALAQAEAWRRGHKETTSVHFLRVVLESATTADELRGRGLDPLELIDVANEALAQLPDASSYRDGAGAPPSGPLARMLVRTRTRRWAIVGARPSALQSLLMEPEVARLVMRLRRGKDCRCILERAYACGVAAEHRAITLEHVMLVLLDVASFASTLERVGGDVLALRSALDASLENAEPTRGAAPVITKEVSSLGSSGDTVRELCLRLARREEASPLWRFAGISGAEFSRAVFLPDSNVFVGVDD